MRVYISGKISGEDPRDVRDKFAFATRQVEEMGHAAVSPLDNGLPNESPWKDHMVADISSMLDCEGIYLLADWHKSKGARIEAAIAAECEMSIIRQEEVAAWVNSNLK